jgi:hypothetical protein
MQDIVMRCQFNALGAVALGAGIVGIFQESSGDPLVKFELLVVQISVSNWIESDGLARLKRLQYRRFRCTFC